MVRVFGSSFPSYGLAVWLLLTNLVLAVYHRHEAADGTRTAGTGLGASPHRANPTAWHYHVLLLGVELEFLSTNSETCPFGPEAPAQEESHVLLATLLGAAQDHELVPDLALLLLADVSLLHVPASLSAEATLPAPPDTVTADPTGPPLADAALGYRSGVQQI
jgi:hypothetical protein